LTGKPPRCVSGKPHWSFIADATLGVNDPLTKKTESPLFLNSFAKVSSDFTGNATN
jgi:hypothetical protein